MYSTLLYFCAITDCIQRPIVFSALKETVIKEIFKSCSKKFEWDLFIADIHHLHSILFLYLCKKIIMKIELEIKDSKAAFFLELVKSFNFVKKVKIEKLEK